MACSNTKNISKPVFAKNPVIAHRGAFKKNNLPENSIAALREAIRLGCTGSEFDIRMTADDSLIINHDPHYNKLDIEKTSYAELIKTKLSNGEKLPTLHEYIQAGLINNKTTRLIFEIKPSNASKERAIIITNKVVEMVRFYNVQNRAVYISFDYDVCKKIHELEPEAAIQYLNGDIAPAQLKKDGINGADYHFSVFTKNPGWIKEAKENNIALNAWTVNREEDMLRLLDQGFDFITTNEPELLFSILKSKDWSSFKQKSTPVK
ncbi:MAG: glycerophosphodiester phosphodiesterase [Sphingobacteriales bacterium]|nr:MAG: glycerophosphodiester phosphodiesterase [Sphingobacteriales bacterium]